MLFPICWVTALGVRVRSRWLRRPITGEAKASFTRSQLEEQSDSSELAKDGFQPSGWFSVCITFYSQERLF
jgi:hypothetical protein